MSLFQRRPKPKPPAQPQQPEASTPADHQPGPIDDTCRQLEAAWRRPAAKRRNTH